MKNKELNILDLGLIGYGEAYAIQKNTAEKRKKEIIPDTLIIAEHYPVLTIGRSGSYKNLLVTKKYIDKRGIKIFEVDRGGDITFHGPGQIVLYPILNLKGLSVGLNEYIRALEEVVISFLGHYNIHGFRINGASGVWAGENKKIGSVGIGVSRWVSYHGASVNINTDLSYFSMIKSCGIEGIEMTSVAKLLDGPVDISEAKKLLSYIFTELFIHSNAQDKVSALA